MTKLKLAIDYSMNQQYKLAYLTLESIDATHV